MVSLPLYLAMLLLVPIIMGIIGLFASRGKVTIKEFLVTEFAVGLILALGVGINLYPSQGIMKYGADGLQIKNRLEFLANIHTPAIAGKSAADPVKAAPVPRFAILATNIQMTGIGIFILSTAKRLK